MPTWVFVLVSLGISSAAVQDVSPQPQPVLREIQVTGATIFNRDDIVWLLKLREGSPLPTPPAEIAKALREAYERDGYSQATVAGAFDQGRLSRTVDEGRIDEIEILGVTAASAERIKRRLGIKPGRHLQLASDRSRHRPSHDRGARGARGGAAAPRSTWRPPR